MKVLVIGATGLTGQIAVRRLLERGDEVTALVRAPVAVTVKHDRLRAAKGEARDADSLDRAVQGQDAVLSAFGPRAAFKKDDLQEVFMRNLVAAMERAGVKRLSNLSAWGAGDSYSALWLPGRIVLRTFLSSFFEDKNRGEAILFASGLDFVNVRPSRLANAPARGNVRAASSPEGLRWWPLMTREDLAAFMIDQLRDDTWLRRSPLIGY
jgi:uncharacterized protein YbjT (DUF2867 family)